MKPLVIDYLRNKSLNQLKIDHGIEHSKHNIDKTSLNYSQINSRNDDSLASECRGLIIARADGGNVIYDEPFDAIVLAWPMNRFFNHGQLEAANIDWGSAVVQEKLDGTLIIVYYDEKHKEWCVATRSVPEANLEINGCSYTFRDLFIKTVNEQYNCSFHEFCEKLFKFNTYCFELTTPYNRVVVPYDRFEINLLCVRAYDDSELDPYTVKLYYSQFKSPKTYSLHNINDIIEFVNSRDGQKNEGVVVVDRHNNRIKIKNVDYLLLHKMQDYLSATPRNCLSIILDEKVDDVIGKLPKEIEESILVLQRQVKDLFIRTEAHQKDILDDHSYSDKDYALCVIEVNKVIPIIVPYLFDVRRNKVKDLNEYVEKQKIDSGEYKKSFLDMILQTIERNNKLYPGLDKEVLNALKEAESLLSNG